MNAPTDSDRGPRNSYADRWPITFEKFRNPPSWLSSALCTFLCIAALFLLFLTFGALKHLTIEMFTADTARASEAVKALLPILAAAFGLPLIIWRLVILNRQTATAEAKTQIDRETHYTSIFSRSVEQLGQTREINEIRESGGAAETVTRTSPNIEVRLGGIHSLSRLADESKRDAKKIENMLLSYVRGNSWSTQDGTSVQVPIAKAASTHTWSYALRTNKNDTKVKAELEKSARQYETISSEETEWTGPLAETRVDVNAAIDAIFDVGKNVQGNEKSTFDESLFVGRNFKSDILNSSKFERCTFVRCRFNMQNATSLRFISCRFVQCAFETKDSKVEFQRSHITKSRFANTRSSEIIFRSCQILNGGIWAVFKSSLTFSHSNSFDTSIGTDSDGPDLNLRIIYSTFLNGQVVGAKLTPTSLFHDAAFANIEFDKVDLSALEDIEDTNLEIITASPHTSHPAQMTRPKSWPEYDPDFSDFGEIPF